ncbi:MAG: competence type IV pilus minor pilin ComGD [Solibacillus sp.]
MKRVALVSLMKRQSNNERGFTLIEMLLVLTIVGVMTSAVLQVSFDQIQRQTYKKTTNQIELAIRMAQLMAMEGQQIIYCEVVNETQFIIRKRPFDEPYYTQDLPAGMKMRITTERGRLQFQPSGNVTQMGKIYFFLNDERLFYTINLGKGRFLLYE